MASSPCNKDAIFFLWRQKTKILITATTDVSSTDVVKYQRINGVLKIETKADSVDLNRKNLISTTNWLINVDKRLTLKQAIPYIKYLQDKKTNSSHKKKGVKNYFTCNDTSKKNLGFVEFTEVVFHDETIREFNKKNNYKEEPDQEIYVEVVSFDSIPVHYATGKCGTTSYTKKDNLLNGIKSDLIESGNVIIHIGYKETLTFQDYIEINSTIKSFSLEHAKISQDEFIFI